MELPKTLAGDLKLLRHLDAERDELQRRIKQLDEMGADAEERVQLAMGDAEEAFMDGKPAFTWKKTQQNRLDQKLLKEKFPRVHEACKRQSEYRTFKVVQESD